jgi:hypothetical protein
MVIEIAVLTMLHTRQYLSLGSSIAAQLVVHDHSGTIRQSLEQLAENLFAAFLSRRRCTRISSTWPSWFTARHR